MTTPDRTIRPGPLNLITDVPGVGVGNAHDPRAWTGVTVVLFETPACIAADVRGGGPGTREIAALDPAATVQTADAVVLSGGSAFGLDAAQGAMEWLAARGRGVAVGPARVPIVPAAILFDLLNGGDKGWTEPPYRALAAEACAAAETCAGTAHALGNAGAGYGAKAGPLKGGLGGASAVLPDGTTVGALVAANPVGSVVMPGSATLWAWPFEQAGEMGGQVPPPGPVPMEPEFSRSAEDTPGANTTLAVVATDADLTRAELQRVAIMAQDGLARAIRPVHTPFDGDVAFACATGRRSLGADGRVTALAAIGAVAADCVARAIGRAVYEAATLGPKPGYREAFGRG